MSTRCIVGIDDRGGRHGRIVHCDGNPEAMLPALAALIGRDGFTTATSTLLAHEWHSVGPDQAADDPTPFGEVVPEYGVRVRPEEMSQWTPDGEEPYEPTMWSLLDLRDDRVDVAYAYFLHKQRGVQIFDAHTNFYVPRRVPLP